jgi:hypothetical protein
VVEHYLSIYKPWVQFLALKKKGNKIPKNCGVGFRSVVVIMFASQELWENPKRYNMHIIGTSEKGRRIFK